ncbi:MAG: hypothetical protein HY716_18200 [Planctomycetes bacterium]|nr:hypothetical protein [Planctomycetota bacterium]
MENKNRLGRLLVETKCLSEEQLKMALDFQKAVGGSLGAIVVKLGFIEDVTLTRVTAREQGLPVVNLEEMVLPENLVRRIPRKLIEKHQVLPIHYKDGILTIATADPFDYEAIEELQLAQDAKIEIHMAPRSAIQKSIKELFASEVAPPREKSKEELLKDFEGVGKHAESPGKHGDPQAHRPPARVSKLFLHEALIPLLIEKGVITEEELVRKAREIEAASEGR